MNPKFELGQKIKHVNDPDIDAGEIIHVSVNNDRILYTIEIEEWNPQARKLFKAVKHIEELEAVEVKEKEEEKEND